MMHTLDSARKTAALCTLTYSSPTVRTPTTMAGRIGDPVRAFTFDRPAEKGSTRSRAIEKIIRVVAVWMASVHTDRVDRRGQDQQQAAEHDRVLGRVVDDREARPDRR